MAKNTQGSMGHLERPMAQRANKRDRGQEGRIALACSSFGWSRDDRNLDRLYRICNSLKHITGRYNEVMPSVDRIVLGGVLGVVLLVVHHKSYWDAMDISDKSVKFHGELNALNEDVKEKDVPDRSAARGQKTRAFRGLGYERDTRASLFLS
jgi:hypothetical protein